MSNHSLLQGIFSNPGTEPRSLTLQADSLPSEPPEKLMPAAAAAAVTSVVSDSVRPHRGQPTRLPHPWDSPGKNTGVGCHFLLQCIKVKSESEVVQSCPTLSDSMGCSLPGSSVHACMGSTQKSDGNDSLIMAVSLGSAMRGEDRARILLRLLCQPEERLCG